MQHRNRRTCFNPRARAGRDVEFLMPRQADSVSIHAPVRGATSSPNRSRSCCRSFNPRARAGRDCALARFRIALEVSIHAPVRGATRRLPSFSFTLPVSIHAPVRGATGTGARASFGIGRFNPRARAGRDTYRLAMASDRSSFQSTRPCGARHGAVGRGEDFELVSIHAPVRGATSGLGSCRRRPRSFNPRARAGRDGLDVDRLVSVTAVLEPLRDRHIGARL